MPSELAVGESLAAERRRAVAMAAEALLRARSTQSPLTALPDGAAPVDEAEAYAVQALVARQLGPVAGWKVGAASATAMPFYAPIHAETLWSDGDRLPADRFHLIGVEAEIAYRLARDLPPRERPYARSEVLAAVASMHPAIEIADSRFVDRAAVDPLSQRADQLSHGALAVGPAQLAWQAIDPVREPVRLTIQDVVRVDAVGGNSAVDPVRLLEWLANVGSHALGGLRAGQVVTTGSCTGTIFEAPGIRIRAEFANLGQIEIAIT